MSRRRAILRSVDVVLRMFDANTHGKGLLREGYTMVLEEFEYIAGGVAAGEDEML